MCLLHQHTIWDLPSCTHFISTNALLVAFAAIRLVRTLCWMLSNFCLTVTGIFLLNMFNLNLLSYMWRFLVCILSQPQTDDRILFIEYIIRFVCLMLKQFYHLRCLALLWSCIAFQCIAYQHRNSFCLLMPSCLAFSIIQVIYGLD